LPEAGEETITFDAMGHLAVVSGKKTLWSSDDMFSTLPYYMQSQLRSGINSVNKKSVTDYGEGRYYLMPRVILNGKEIITIANNEGMSGFFSKVKLYTSTRIVAFTPRDAEIVERSLAEVQKSYCTDITLDKGSVLALIVKKSTSFVQRVDLQ